MKLCDYTVDTLAEFNWIDLGPATFCFDSVSDSKRTKLAALAEISRQGCLCD